MKKENKISSFVVKEDSWLRGKGSWNSRLYDLRSGEKCCLGFLANACGLSNAAIVDIKSPGAQKLKNNFDKFPKELIDSSENISGTYDAFITIQIMEINDNEDISDEERKEKLKNLFTSINIDIKFE